MEIKDILIDDLKPDPNQPRKYFDPEAEQELANSMKNGGIINPIEIDENNVIITGERRWRASRLSGLIHIPCKIVTGLTPIERLIRQTAENASRQPLKYSEQREVVQRILAEKDYTNEEVAKMIGISDVRVGEILKVEKGPSILKKAVKLYDETKGREGIDLGSASSIMDLDTQAERKSLAQDLIKNKKTQKEVKELIKEKKIAKKAIASKDNLDKEIKFPDQKEMQEVLDYYDEELQQHTSKIDQMNMKIHHWQLDFNQVNQINKEEITQLILKTRQNIEEHLTILNQWLQSL